MSEHEKSQHMKMLAMWVRYVDKINKMLQNKKLKKYNRNFVDRMEKNGTVS